MGLKKNPNIMLKKIFIKTFGCQMNEYDSNRIFDTVKKIGFEKTEKYEDANCYLLNTCHIRDKAKEKVYHEIGRVKKIFREKKKPIVIVAGCVAQAENQEMLKKIFIKTFGCQMNEYDSNRIFDTVKKIGFEKTEKYEDANCYLLNTCHIREIKPKRKYIMK